MMIGKNVLTACVRLLCFFALVLLLNTSALGEHKESDRRTTVFHTRQESRTLEDPLANPIKLEIDNSPVKGNPGGRITVVGFSDFQCPFCAQGKQVMEYLLKEYPEDVKFVFKHLPLPFHKEAQAAAKAAEAARVQGKFWEMHDLLFKHQKDLRKQPYLKYAKKLDLDVKQFQADMDSEEIYKRITSDRALAVEAGATGTPTYFVNGVRVQGARRLPYFKDLVERWLDKLAMTGE